MTQVVVIGREADRAAGLRAHMDAVPGNPFQAFALRHDVVDRAGGERHGFLAAVIFEPLEHGIAMPEAVHVAGRQLGAEGIVGGEGVPVGQVQ